jgi:sugar lactone lactonase YvrE
MRGAAALLAFAQATSNKYLLITTPENSPEKVWYMLLPSAASSTTTDDADETTTASPTTADTETTADDTETTTASNTGLNNPSLKYLVKDSHGLAKPIGIAMDHARNGLYVADWAMGKILRWDITEDTTLQTLTASDKSTEIYSGGYVGWLAVDALGNLFFSDEDTSTIWKVSGEDLIVTSRSKTDKPYYPSYELNCPGVYGTNKPTPVVVYSREDTKTSEVSGPGGLAVDNFHVFWGNKQLGTQVGSVVKGFESSTADKVKQPIKIALNTERVYGICLAGNNVYFTDKRTNIYGVKKHGGGIATISPDMKDPRGCTWDGDGTIYVADMEGGKVKSFPANMLNLAPQKLKDVASVFQPMSLAVYETTVSNCVSGALRVASAALVLVFALQ